MIIIDVQFIEKIILDLCRESKDVMNLNFSFVIKYLECWGMNKKILIFDIDHIISLWINTWYWSKTKIVSIFHWKVSPSGAEIKWLVDEW